MDKDTKREPVVLVVDDDEAAMAAVVKLLGRRGFQMLTAPNGVEGLKILEEHREIDVIVLDVMMPRMTGLEVCAELRKRPHLIEIPVILLTGCDDLETRVAGMKLGISEFLCKPFSHLDLIDRINSQLHARAIAKEISAVERRL
ncbi:MAG: two-component system response regulator [Candidatus Binatia bacterium]